MVKTKEDLVGRKVGRLIVIKQVDDYIGSNGKHYDQWMCECSCKEFAPQKHLYEQYGIIVENKDDRD